jgi:hypothetical protein
MPAQGLSPGCQAAGVGAGRPRRARCVLAPRCDLARMPVRNLHLALRGERSHTAITTGAAVGSWWASSSPLLPWCAHTPCHTLRWCRTRRTHTHDTQNAGGKKAHAGHHAVGATGPHAGDKKPKNIKGSGATKKGECASGRWHCAPACSDTVCAVRCLLVTVSCHACVCACAAARRAAGLRSMRVPLHT